MLRRIGIHDCRMHYREDCGLYTVVAVLEGDARSPSAYDLVLDTGAAFIGVKGTLFDSVHPRNIQPYQYVDASGSVRNTRKGTVNVLVDGRLKANNVDIVQLRTLPYRNVSGLLGMSFLRHFGMYLDINKLRALNPGETEIPMLRFHYYSADNYEA